MAEKVKSYTLELDRTVKRFEQYCRENNKIEKKELVKAMEYYLDEVVKYWKYPTSDDDDLPF